MDPIHLNIPYMDPLGYILRNKTHVFQQLSFFYDEAT